MVSGVGAVEAVSAVAACLTNEGPGLGSVGPMGNYASLGEFAKWVLSACMLLGRLEIFTVLVLFSGAFWKE
jgi:trk system potassium uptake protein TrkH